MKAAFMFIAPETDHETHQAVITTPVAELTVVGVKNYQETEMIAKKLVEDGIQVIELCAGFGNNGVAAVNRAIKGQIPVGVVRFDHHPGFGFKSGDALFE
ncbi:hypothetical protein U14_04148 [Candidatus Moduliflexus flocculans]|uniref:Uncharacterized protein n=1 Tax=Candidatus Moduliflexus flocculans TaxID=1499966 RepID=A0A0S6W3C9_9BACT|nr:hypothetical protein U14_04148 [Candidatus Moduliflexus flocculans]